MLNVLHCAKYFVAITEGLPLSKQILSLEKPHNPQPSCFSKISEQCYLFKFIFNKPLQILGTDPAYIIKKCRNIPT